MKPPPRFIIAQSALADSCARVTGRELHHLRDVMRLGTGSAVVLFTSEGHEYAGRILRLERDAAIVAVDRRDAVEGERRRLILAAALIKAPRMDLLVEKAAELGAAELWPLVCSRSPIRGPGEERLNRWQRISLAAAKQSLSAQAMKIAAPASVESMSHNLPKKTLAIMCSAGATPLGALLRCSTAATVVLACGPEGGFTEGERAALSRAGFVAAGLAANRLRSETAALAALSIVAGSFNERATADRQRREQQ